MGWVWGQKFRPRGSPGLCRGYEDLHGDSESPWVWVWGEYGDRNSVPTAALDSAVGMGIPMGIRNPHGYGYGVSMGTEIPSPRQPCRSQ